MEESQKRASSGKLDEKSSLLDMDIGNDFITSWKSMSMAEDNAMDFDFAPDSKDKKKSFNFDKADMDFNLDADFGKIPSFNMDMPDLDISSPFKKDGKSREKSIAESANGKNKAKADHFSFSLDFDELGSFGFGSSLTKEGTKAEKNNDRGKNSKRRECQDEKDPSHTNFIENMSMPENELFEKPLSPRTATTSDMDTQVDGSAGIDSPSEKSSSEYVMGDIGTSNFSTAIDQVGEQKARKSPDLKFSSSRQQNICQFEKTISLEPINQEACITNGASKDLSAHSAFGNGASQITGSQLLEVGTVDTNLTSSSGEQNVIKKPIAGSDSIDENTKIENSSLQGVAISQKNNDEEVGTENHTLIGNKEKIEHGQGDSIVQNSPITTVVTGSKKTNAENQRHASEILKSPLTSIPVDNFISEEERGAVVTRSRFFVLPDKTEPYLQKAQSTQTTTSSLSSKVMSPTEPSLLDKNRDLDAIDIVGDGILASFPLQHSRAVIRTEPQQPENQEICKGVTIDGQGTSADGVQDGRKLNTYFPSQDQDVVEVKSAQKENRKNPKNVATISLNMQLRKNTPQNCPFPRISASATTSLLTPRNTSAEVEKSSPVNSRRKLDPCGLKLSRTYGSDLESSESVSHEDVKSLGSSSHKGILLGNEPSKITPSASGTASLLTMKNRSVEAQKFTHVNAGERNLDLSGLRLSRTSESNHDSTRSVGCKDVKSLGNITQNKLMAGNESSNSTIGTLKKTPSPPSLKRKTLGEFNSSMMLLNPSKRLSQSRSENRNFAAISERVIDKKVSNHENLKDGSTESTCQDSTLDASHEMNMKELDAPFSIENNTYVEQAEACTKELEDICNMLSKKHEEAKEILVRAIVNNNKLLMLNHPLYEEKIQMVQKFAARLTLSETRA